jgi:hypothetical protein
MGGSRQVIRSLLLLSEGPRMKGEGLMKTMESKGK